MLSEGVLVALIAVPASLLGGGGIAGIITARSLKKQGIKQEDRADDNSVSNQAQELVKTQFEMLVKPLREEVSRLTSKMAEMEAKYDATQHRYWVAIKYLRELRHWIEVNVPDRKHDLPQPAEELNEDL